PHTGQAHLIGVTGAPGTGKSSLVNQLALHYRKNTNKRVAIVAIDPTSPFTGGAVLGDRVRMRDLSGDEEFSSARWLRAVPWEASPEKRHLSCRCSTPRGMRSLSSKRSARD